MRGDLEKLLNIGAVLARQLEEVGIDSPQALNDAGSRAAWLRIQENDPSACLNRLCALEGAVRNVRWYDLPDSMKAELKEFYRKNKI